MTAEKIVGALFFFGSLVISLAEFGWFGMGLCFLTSVGYFMMNLDRMN